MAARAATARGAALLSAWRPIAEAAARRAETVLLREAIARQAEPGEWCHAAPGEPGARLAPEAGEALDGPGLGGGLGWLQAARATPAARGGEGSRRRGIVHDVSGTGRWLLVEPIEACEANNHLIELRSGVAAEEARILRELAGRLIEAGPEFLALEAGLVHLDTLGARARWAAEVGAIALEPGAHAGTGPARAPRLRLLRARHPLLALGARRESLVPLDLELEPPGTLLLVSGPNMV